jgi:D-lactate dehydrogenase
LLTGKYGTLYNRLTERIDQGRLFHDPMYTLALGTDASFYRLIPEIVIRARDEEEVSFILKECSELDIPVTFRAAGTSLSGQSVTDSVLLIAGADWKQYSITKDGSEITLQPGLTGGRVNALLAPYGKKIGPDPASINAAMIGGMAANNASGMCCGTAKNSFGTVSGMRIITADGTILDTSDEESKNAFAGSHPDFLNEITTLADSVKKNLPLAEKIRRKYKMKNTTGYSLNALTDFDDPFDIIKHLMIGSEGTLGFISRISLKTVPEHPFRASSLILFPDIEKASTAVALLKPTPVLAVELIDRAGLRSVENEAGMPYYLKTLGEKVCALLVETAAPEKTELHSNIALIKSSVISVPTMLDIMFTDIPAEYEVLWNIRKGLFPSVGAMRKSGTTVIIEDVAFPVNRLAEATSDLQGILKKYDYSEAVIFGHALEGNLHFVFPQDFSSPAEVTRYGNLMKEVSELVVKKYDGSLKTEHGTGRNMAPYVEMEWGKEAYGVMKEIKKIFDPKGILNPGVILNEDPAVHLRNLKPMPESSTITDKCIECGFCEYSCVSAGLTLSPRQRIAVHREITALSRSGQQPHIAASLAKSYKYAGMDTCATDGLCSVNCPVKIDTGKLIKELRRQHIGSHDRISLWIASNMNVVTSAARISLTVIDFSHALLGTRVMKAVSAGIRKITFNTVPRWNPYMPKGAGRIKKSGAGLYEKKQKVVYFPSCINRSMGVSRDHKKESQLSVKTVELLKKGGYEPIYPENMDNLCCGMAFLSKGYTRAGEKKSQELEAALLKASNYGEYPVLCDMSPCLFTMKENMKPPLKLYEPVEFIMTFLLPKLEITPADETITVFPVCSMKKMGLEKRLVQLAEACVKKVVVPESNCCGFAGDRGFTFPELNRYGLSGLKEQIGEDAKSGYSTSRTCEIGLSENSEISFKSIIYLVDRVSRSKAGNKD